MAVKNALAGGGVAAGGLLMIGAIVFAFAWPIVLFSLYLLGHISFEIAVLCFLLLLSYLGT